MRNKDNHFNTRNKCLVQVKNPLRKSRKGPNSYRELLSINNLKENPSICIDVHYHCNQRCLQQ